MKTNKKQYKIILIKFGDKYKLKNYLSRGYKWLSADRVSVGYLYKLVR